MPHAQLMPKPHRSANGLGAANADLLLAEALTSLLVAGAYWALIWPKFQQAESSTAAVECGGTLDASYAGTLQSASQGFCRAASYAVQAAQIYASRCQTAAHAAMAAKHCPALDLTGEQGQGTPWGVIWNGQANCLDTNLVLQVAKQMQQAQASVAAAQAAHSVACPRVIFDSFRPFIPVVTTPPAALFAGIGRARRIVGVGDITQTPEYQAAVKQLTDQLTLEGQSSFDIQGSIQAMGDTFNQLNQQMGSPSDALQASLKYTLGTKSFGAAVDMVSGLVTAATSGEPPAELLQTFTGTMIGVMVLAGGVSAGVGAAVMAAAAIVIGLLQQLGFFPGQPTGTALPGCPGVTYTGQGPSYQLPLPGWGGVSNVVYAWPDPYWDSSHKSGLQPGAPLWRKFPVQLAAAGSLSAVLDVFWFAPFSGGVQSSPGQWNWPKTLSWQPSNDNKPLNLYFCWPNTNLGSLYSDRVRFIDIAFPLYHHMECEMAAGEMMFAGLNSEIIQALTNFDVVFFTALKLNWEYALNGITPPASDLEVLVHTIYTWNRAHAPGHGWDITPAPTDQPWMPDGTACSGLPPPWYAAILASNVGSSTQPAGVMSADGTKLHINTGAPKPFSLQSQGIPIGIPIHISPGSVSAAPPASSTLANIAVGTATAVGVAAAGLGVYSLVTKQRYLGVLESLWSETKTGARASVRKVKGIFRR
jgi:hypothetical protein